jgi:hypothetical protein
MDISQIKRSRVWAKVPVRAVPLQNDRLTFNFVPTWLEDCCRQDHARTTVVVNRNSFFDDEFHLSNVEGTRRVLEWQLILLGEKARYIEGCRRHWRWFWLSGRGRATGWRRHARSVAQ